MLLRTSKPITGCLLLAILACSRQPVPENSDRDRALAESSFATAEELRRQYESTATEEALAQHEISLAAWKRIGDLDSAARVSQSMGTLYEQTGELEKALLTNQEGLELAREAGARSLESELASAVGAAHVLLGDPNQAEIHCRQGLAIAQEVGSLRGQALAHNCLGEVDYFRGNLQEALEVYSRAHQLWIESGDQAGQAQTLLYLGYASSDLSELDDAGLYYRDALALWQAIGDRRGEALTQIANGHLLQRLGDHQAALNAFSEGLTIFESMDDRVWQAGANSGLGNVYFDMREHTQALAYWSRALVLFHDAGLQMAEVELLQSTGEILLAFEDYETAIEHFQRALTLTRELENGRWEAHSLLNLGRAYDSLGDPHRAIEFLQQALAIQQSGEDRRYEAYALADLGKAYEDIGEHAKARSSFRRALDLSRESHDRLGEAIGLFNLATDAAQHERLEEALDLIQEALDIAESLRTGVESHDLRSSYMASIQSYYELQIAVLMGMQTAGGPNGYSSRAFEASERARARSLLENLTAARVDIRQGVDADLLQREQELKQKLDMLADQQIRRDGEPDTKSDSSALGSQIRDTSLHYDQLQAEIRSKSPRYAALTQPQPLGLEQVQERVLDDETLVLEYSLGEEQSYLWAVERHDHLTVELPPRMEIEEATRDLYQILTARLPVADESVKAYRLRVKEADERYLGVATRLANLLLGPVADRMSGKRIVVVSDGAMQYIPFAALPLPHGGDEFVPMIVEHEIVNLPSVSALAILRQETRGRQIPPRSVAVLADPIFELDDPRVQGAKDPQVMPRRQATAPDLRSLGVPGSLGIPRLVATRQEAEGILAVAPSSTGLQALDFAASRSLAMSGELRDYRIIHFATHGIVNNQHPGLSGVLLSMFDEDGTSTNGFLRLHDIYNLELPAELVVLSACNSALGKPVDGEGLVGIVRGFMHAGAKRVVASLWKVDDEATGDLMRHFYQGMFSEQQTPSAALRQAQLAMWKDSDWQSPFYWAAFVLQGEWQ